MSTRPEALRKKAIAHREYLCDLWASRGILEKMMPVANQLYSTFLNPRFRNKPAGAPVIPLSRFQRFKRWLASLAGKKEMELQHI